jgi:hypothetical protein
VHRYFFRTVTVVYLCFAIFFAGELAFEWWRLGMPGHDAMSWVDNNNAKLMDLMSPLARAYNNVLAMLIATIGLAIPLTANMHTPKLIEMFIRDRLNQVVLFGCAFCAANVLWVAYIIGPHFAPTWAIALAVIGALVGWATLIPYFFYIIRFLDPSNILRRLENETKKALSDVRDGKLKPNDGQALVHERLQEIGTIVVKSLDRTDRDIALEGIWIFKRLFDHYGTLKKSMPEGWFVVDRADFVGVSAEGLALIQEEKLFFERKVLQQLFYAYSHAVGKAADVVSSISDCNRVVAVIASERGDEPAVQLSLRYFNNFLRESMRLKHVHSIYDVFLQYRLLAQQLHHRPQLVRDVARYLAAYANESKRAGLGPVPMFAAFDLAAIAIEAYTESKDVAADVLGQALSVSIGTSAAREDMVVEARIKLGAALLKAGHEDAAKRVRESLKDIPADDLRRLGDELLAAPHAYHEVTDRQVDMRWVPNEDRESVSKFVASCAA